MKRIDIILPCHNPPAGWEKTVVSRFNEIRGKIKGYQFHLIIVNDGSTKNFDDELASTFISNTGLELIEYQINKGKGHALRQGMAAAKGDWQIYTDIDFPYTFESMENIIAALESGVDIASGERDMHYYERVPGMRKRLSRSLRFLMRQIFRLKVSDTQCGLKGMGPDGREMFLQTTIDRYLFDLEFLMNASRQSDVRIQPVPVQLREGVTFSKVGWRILFSESRNLLRIILQKK